MYSEEINSGINTIQKIITGLQSVIKGRDETIKLVVTALIADGHVLLEDYPGSGKTTLTKTLGGLIDCSESQDKLPAFRRVQFTPDLLPGDVLGVTIFDAKNSQFRFVEGPVFAHILLADEINRTGPKVQAAFLECMAEKQVTIDNKTYKLDDLFFVIGTQNPLDIAGTYPLPLVQLDRFLFKIPMSYVDAKTELEILSKHQEIIETLDTIKPACTRSEILLARKAAKSIKIAEPILKAIVELVQTSRNSSLVQFGASTRAAIMLQQALKAYALTNKRDYVTEQDLKEIAAPVLIHRLKFNSGAGKASDAFNKILEPVLEKLISGAFQA